MNVKDYTYFEIAYQTLCESIEEFERIDLKDIEQINFCTNKLRQNYHIIIVFSVMCLEAFINDYLAVCLTDDFFYSNLDKLSLKQKIEVIYKLVWNDNLDKSTCMYKYLSEMIKERNNFVHAKSSKMTEGIFDKVDTIIDDECFISSFMKLEFNSFCEFFNDSFNAIKTIYLFCIEVDNHDKNRNATALLLRCISPNKFDFMEALPKIIKNEINKLEMKIKNIKNIIKKVKIDN